MNWHLSNRFDPACLPLIDGHYSRQKPGTNQFVQPGRCIVFKAYSFLDVAAVWATSYPEFARHAWDGAWNNSVFCNRGAGLSSDLIRDAIAATRWAAERKSNWGNPPELGIITFVDPTKVKSGNPGYCYLKAGFTKLRERTESGLLVFQMLPDEMPEPAQPASFQLDFASLPKPNGVQIGGANG